MYAKEDTICALSTPAGRGALAVIRCSGPKAIHIAGEVVRLPASKGSLSAQPSNTIHFAHVYDSDELIDQVMVSLFRTPHSYSGEDTVEISCHGSPYIQKRLLELLVQSGARMATAGEFTMRAFLNGKLDLTQVEAVADLIASDSRASHRIALMQMKGGFTREIRQLRSRLVDFTSLVELELDFSEEDVEFADRRSLAALLNEIIGVLKKLAESFTLGNVIKRGIPVTLAGRTNVGKSTLLNLLLREERALVSEMEGTTRDAIEDIINIRGVYFRLIDTAGLRQTTDAIEKLGIQKTWEKIEQAIIVLHVLDAQHADRDVRYLREMIEKSGEYGSKRHIVLLNKIDETEPQVLSQKMESIQGMLKGNESLIPFSAKTGQNLDLLEQALIDASMVSTVNENDIIISNVRHFEALEKALAAMIRAADGLSGHLPGDLLSQDIREALHYLGEITGDITTDEILGNIFKNFCIGK
jgi:tRNA modification GTPase